MKNEYFKLISLELFDHEILKNLKIEFINENFESDRLLTTLLIGPNGTGKSEILRAIIDIFRELEYQKIREKKSELSVINTISIFSPKAWSISCRAHKFL